MRYSAEHKAQTRRRILDAAATVFRRCGYQAAGVDAVMAEAGLTAGGFYAHFANKEALFAATIPHALELANEQLRARITGPPGLAWIEQLAQQYLSRGHRQQVEAGCPLPALLPEISRAGPASKQALEAALQRAAAQLTAQLSEDRAATLPAQGDTGLAILALLVGGMTLSRGVADAALGEAILVACQKFLTGAIAADRPQSAEPAAPAKSLRSKSPRPKTSRSTQGVRQQRKSS